MQITADIEGLDSLIAELDDWPKESDLAEVRALNTVGRKARTLTVRTVAKGLGVKQKPIRDRIKVFRAKRRNKTTKLWGGTRVPLRMKEIGFANAEASAPAGARVFEARMGSGHRGAFYRANTSKNNAPPRHTSKPGRAWGDPDLPISEAVRYITAEVNDDAPNNVRLVFDREFATLYWKDFRFRVDRAKKRHGGR